MRCTLREGVPRVVNYLDDFCLVSTDRMMGCRDQEVVIAILRQIGFFVSFGKLVSTSTTACFLGIIIDTIKLEMRLPEDKFIRLATILDEVKGRRKFTRKELERIGGLLAHCSKVVKGCRTFCRCIYDAINSVKEPHFKVRLSSGFRDDIKWWCGFAALFMVKPGYSGHLLSTSPPIVTHPTSAMEPSMGETGSRELFLRVTMNALEPKSGTIMFLPIKIAQPLTST